MRTRTVRLFDVPITQLVVQDGQFYLSLHKGRTHFVIMLPWDDVLAAYVKCRPKKKKTND